MIYSSISLINLWSIDINSFFTLVSVVNVLWSAMKPFEIYYTGGFAINSTIIEPYNFNCKWLVQWCFCLGNSCKKNKLSQNIYPQDGSSFPTQKSCYSSLLTICLQYNSIHNQFLHILPADQNFSCTGWGERGVFFYSIYKKKLFIYIY